MRTRTKVLYILSWIPLAAIKLILVLLGLIVVPIAEAHRIWPRWAWVWGNELDDVPEWWTSREHPWFIKYWPNFWWFAVRNPVNNLRFIFDDYDLDEVNMYTNWGLTEPMEAQQMIDAGVNETFRWIGKGPFAGYRRVWLTETKQYPELDFSQGRITAIVQWFSDRWNKRFKWITEYSEIWFGWKLASDVPGLGFTTQVRLNREIGT